MSEAERAKVYTDAERIEQLEADLNTYRKGLLRITGINPTRFIQGPMHKGGLAITKAFVEAQAVAEHALGTVDEREYERTAPVA